MEKFFKKVSFIKMLKFFGKIFYRGPFGKIFYRGPFIKMSKKYGKIYLTNRDPYITC